MNKNIVLSFTLILLLLSSCSAPDQVGTDQASIGGDFQPQAWMDAPLNESYLPLDSYEIVFHISGQEGVAMGELSINNQVVDASANPESSKKLATLNYLWQPSEPGTYLLSVRAQGIDGTWGPEAQSIVYVGEITDTFTPPPLELIATPLPIVISEAPASFSDFAASPSAVHYGNCTPNQLSVSVTASDPTGVNTVGLFYRMRDTEGNFTDWSNAAMNRGANDQFYKVINLAFFESPYESGILDIQLIITNNNGELVRSDVYTQVGISSCFQPLIQFDFSEYRLIPGNLTSIPMTPTSTPVVVR